MKNLLKETFVYKVDTEEQAAQLIDAEKASSKGVVNYKADFKTKTSKGEIVDSWWIVTITHDYTK